MKCWNEKCDKYPLDNINCIHVGDGDFVCNEYCKKEFENQRKKFFNNLSDDDWYNNWMNQ